MEFKPLASSSGANAYILKSGQDVLLIEAGLKIKKLRKALNHNLRAVCGCIITHLHQDHARGAGELMAAGTDIWMTAETAEHLKLSGHRLHIIEPLKQFEVSEFKILPFPTQHDCPGSVGFLVSDRVEKLCFLTDSFYSRFSFMGVTIYAVECNYSRHTLQSDLEPYRLKRLLTSHMSLENCIEFFKANDLSKTREIFLLHLSAANSNAEMFKKEIQAATGKPVTVCDK